MARKTCDILISGGGVAGLTAAAAFGRAGFSVLLVDPKPPITDANTEGADLRTTAFLQPARDFLIKAGLWDQLAPLASPLQTMKIVDASSNEAVSRSFDADDISDEPFGWNLPNWLLRREMMAKLEGLPNVELRLGVGFERSIARTRTLLARLTDGTSIEAALLVGADGRHSVVRKDAGIEVATTRYGQTALTFAVTHDMAHANVSTEIHKSGGPFTLVPLPDREGQPCSAVVWMTDNKNAARLLALNEDGFSTKATERSDNVLGPLQLATRRTSWPIISQMSDRLIGPRTALVAEAAHVMPPIGAQGLNMSLTDLRVLLDLSIEHRCDLGGQDMLKAYDRARHADIKLRVTGIDLLNRASIAGNPMLQDLRRLGVKALYDIEPIRKAVMKMGLGAKT